MTRIVQQSLATEGRIYMSNIKKAFDHGKAFIPFITRFISKVILLMKSMIFSLFVLSQIPRFNVMKY